MWKVYIKGAEFANHTLKFHKLYRFLREPPVKGKSATCTACTCTKCKAKWKSLKPQNIKRLKKKQRVSAKKIKLTTYRSLRRLRPQIVPPNYST